MNRDSRQPDAETATPEPLFSLRPMAASLAPPRPSKAPQPRRLAHALALATTIAAVLLAISARGSAAARAEPTQTVLGAPSPRVTESGAEQRWQHRTVHVVLDSSLHQLGPDAHDAVRLAFGTWLDSGADLPQLVFEVDSGPSVGPARDNVNRISAGTVPGHEGELATTISHVSTKSGAVIESDIVINILFDYTVAAEDSTPDRPSPNCKKQYDIQSVVAHEAGHFFGLDEDRDDREATMYYKTSKCEVHKRDLANGDSHSVRGLYSVWSDQSPQESSGCSLSTPRPDSSASSTMILGLLLMATALRLSTRKGNDMPATEHGEDVLLAGANVPALASGLTEAGFSVRQAADEPHALRAINKMRPRVMVIDMASEDGRRIALAARGNPALSMIPIIAVSNQVDDLSFAEVYDWGGDDLVGAQATAGLLRRICTLPRTPPTIRPERGLALLADADDRRRVLLARVMRNAGFDAAFAVSSDELVEAARHPEIAIVVASSELPGLGTLEALAQSRESSDTAPWIVSTPPREMARVSGHILPYGQACVHDSYAPVENVLFTANELLSRARTEMRASPRMLYGTTVGFRAAGRDVDDFGYLYNISAGGLYIRTLAPLSVGDDAWLELAPPRTSRRVRLEARVVWSRAFGDGRAATVPPGFGVQLTDGSQKDLALYRQGYAAFARDLAGIRTSNAPTSHSIS